MSDDLPIYFPEPSEPDDTWGGFGEQPVDWFLRSTLPRARSIRASLNANLNRFPRRYALPLSRKMRAAWQSHFFELVVGCWLQELGADVEPEPKGSNDTRIDFLATFADGQVGVEAASKVYNRELMEQLARDGSASGMDNSELRIRAAVRDKGKWAQAAGISVPALLAVDGGTLASDLEDFDVAVLGSNVEVLDHQMERVGETYVATGEFSRDPLPPWAGVLAFLDVGAFGTAEPVLYVSPHFHGHLPNAFLRIERRELAIRKHSGRSDAMSRVRFADP